MSQNPKALSHMPFMGQVYETPPGSKSMAYSQSNQVNVGDPDSSSVTEVLADKCNSEGVEMAVRKSDGPYYR